MMAESNATTGGQGITLTPDPSILTREAMTREIAGLRELMRVELTGEAATIGARLDAMDRAIVVFSDSLFRVPTDVDKQVGNLRELHGEKFSSVQTQFLERDARVEQSARDTKIAVDAALLAAEKAVAKAEVSTTKQIDALGVTLQTATGGLEKQIADLKDRQTRIESLNLGRSEQATDMRAWAAFGFTLILFLLTLVSFVITNGIRP